MIEPTFWILTALATIFYLVASFSNSRTSRIFLIPAGATLILISGMIFTSGTLKVDAGDYEETIENKTTKITEVNRTRTYRSIDSKYPFDASLLIALLLIGIGSASIMFGANITAGNEKLM